MTGQYRHYAESCHTNKSGPMERPNRPTTVKNQYGKKEASMATEASAAYVGVSGKATYAGNGDKNVGMEGLSRVMDEVMESYATEGGVFTVEVGRVVGENNEGMTYALNVVSVDPDAKLVITP